MTREEHFPHGNVGFWILSESMFPVIANKNRTKDTLKNIYNTFFLTMPFVHTTRLGNRTYQIFCSMNHFSKMINMFCCLNESGFHSDKFDRSADLWKILENDELSLFGYYLWLDKLSRRSETILDESHQDISGRKLRKIGKIPGTRLGACATERFFIVHTP